MKTIYIAGKISGLPFDEVVKKFAKAQTELEAKGYKVMNPVALIIHQNEKRRANNLPPLTDEKDRAEILKICVTNLIYYCDSIYLLNDWHISNGAIMEYHVAFSLGMEIMHQPEQTHAVQISIVELQKKDTNEGISYGFHAENGGIEQCLKYIKSNDDAGLSNK